MPNLTVTWAPPSNVDDASIYFDAIYLSTDGTLKKTTWGAMLLDGNSEHAMPSDATNAVISVSAERVITTLSGTSTPKMVTFDVAGELNTDWYVYLGEAAVEDEPEFDTALTLTFCQWDATEMVSSPHDFAGPGDVACAVNSNIRRGPPSFATELGWNDTADPVNSSQQVNNAAISFPVDTPHKVQVIAHYRAAFQGADDKSYVANGMKILTVECEGDPTLAIAGEAAQIEVEVEEE